MDEMSYYVIKLANGKFFSISYPNGCPHVRCALNFPLNPATNVHLQLRDACKAKGILMPKDYKVVRVDCTVSEG